MIGMGKMKKGQKGHNKVLLIFSIVVVLLLSVLTAGCGSDAADEEILYQKKSSLL